MSSTPGLPNSETLPSSTTRRRSSSTATTPTKTDLRIRRAPRKAKMGKEITSISMRRPEPEVAPIPVAEIVVPEVAAPIAQSSVVGKQVWNLLQYPLLAIVGVAIIYSSLVGQLLVAAFGVIGLALKLPSKWAFGAALFLLVTVPLFIALNRQGIADTLAVYVFELLVVGTVMAMVELRRES